MAQAAAKKTAPKKTSVKSKQTDKAKKSPAPEQNNPEKSGKNKIAILGAIVAIVAVVALAINLGNLGKGLVEKVASDTLGVKVSIAKIDVSLQDKQITVSDLTIGNPPGYKGPYAVKVDQVAISADAIKKQLLTLNQIRVSKPVINLEVHEKGTNLTAIRDHAMAQAKVAKKAPGEDETKVIIHELRIDQATLNPGSLLSEQAAKPVTLPNIRLRGIGEQNNGVLPAQAIAQIADYVVQVAARSSLQAGFMDGMNPDSLKAMQQDLGLPTGLMDEVRGLGEKVKGLFGN